MRNSIPLFASLLLLVIICIQCTEFAQGKILYENYCASCHMDDGTGLELIYPPLAGSDYIRDNQDKLPCIISKGLLDTILVNGNQYSGAMGGYPQLNNVEITNIINYINSAWGNDYGLQKLRNVTPILEECAELEFEFNL